RGGEGLGTRVRARRGPPAAGPGLREPGGDSPGPRLPVRDLVRGAQALSARIPETLVTLLLAAVFGLAGDLVLARRSSSLREWIESFLVGAGVSAAALFPLSLALPGRGLDALAPPLAPRRGGRSLDHPETARAEGFVAAPRREVLPCSGPAGSRSFLDRRRLRDRFPGSELALRLPLGRLPDLGVEGAGPLLQRRP